MNEKPTVTQIQFVTKYLPSPFSRQLSVERFARDKIRFCFGDENFERCDYYVVYGGKKVICVFCTKDHLFDDSSCLDSNKNKRIM